MVGIYLDNAATSYPKPDCVYEAVEYYMRHNGTSSGRGGYRLALEADRIVYEARRALARLFGVRDPSRIIFTSNVTESINLAIRGLVRPGDHVVTTSLEHNAVWRCLKTLESEIGLKVDVVPCSAEGSLDLDKLIQCVLPSTKLIVMIHASNVIGSILPVREVGSLARERGIPLLVDAAQTAGVIDIDVERDMIDLLAFTGHKGLLGPMGTGGLYIREGFEPRPLKAGGTGSESKVENQSALLLPDRYEAGTMNVGGIAGLRAAAEFILTHRAEIENSKRTLTAYTLEKLSRLPGIRLYGPKDPERQIGVISFNVLDFSPDEVAFYLDRVHGIMVRAGLHCAPLAHRTIGTYDRGTVRVSPGYFNTLDHVDALGEALYCLAKRGL